MNRTGRGSPRTAIFLAASLSALGCSASTAGTAGIQAQVRRADPAAVAAHVAKAKAIAGSELRTPLELCDDAGHVHAETEEEKKHDPMPALMANSYMEPVRVFDHLYFVGTKWVSSWVLATSNGLIVIDALDNDREARDSLEEGLRKLGLDPADIRYLIITHAHGDHYGGANYLVQKYRPKVLMSEMDWRELERRPLEFDSPLWGRPPRRDGTVRDGERLTLGDTTIEIYVTPGHTPGAISFVRPVSDRGQPHRALLWGGFGVNVGPVTSRFRSFIGSTQRAQAIVREKHADVLLANHPGIDDSLVKMKALGRRVAREPHPYVIGEKAVAGFLAVAGECAAAALASFDAGAVPP